MFRTIIGLIFGLLLLGYGGYRTAGSLQLALSGQRTVGTIVDVTINTDDDKSFWEQVLSRRRRDTYSAVIRFQPLSGAPVTFRPSTADSRPPQIGAPINVIYLPAVP